MKLAVAVDPGNDGSVRITISYHNKDHFSNSNLLAVRFKHAILAMTIKRLTLVLVTMIIYLC